MGAAHWWPLKVVCNPEIGGTVRKVLCQNRKNLQDIFPPKCLPWWSHQQSGAGQSWGTQFLIFLLLPGLSRLRTVNGTKQKQERGQGVPHKRQREGEEERKEASFSPVYFKRTKNQPSILYKNMVAESGSPSGQPPSRAQPFTLLKLPPK